MHQKCQWTVWRENSPNHIYQALHSHQFTSIRFHSQCNLTCCRTHKQSRKPSVLFTFISPNLSYPRSSHTAPPETRKSPTCTHPSHPSPPFASRFGVNFEGATSPPVPCRSCRTPPIVSGSSISVCCCEGVPPSIGRSAVLLSYMLQTRRSRSASLGTDCASSSAETQSFQFLP